MDNSSIEIFTIVRLCGERGYLEVKKSDFDDETFVLSRHEDSGACEAELFVSRTEISALLIALKKF